MASGAGRGLQARWCRCGAPVLAGLDGDVCAFPAVVDIGPLSAIGEAVARIQGRRTFEIRKRGAFQLMRRNRHAIRDRPPGRRAWCGPIDVVAEHVCHSFPLPSTPSAFTETENERADNDQPPF